MHASSRRAASAAATMHCSGLSSSAIRGSKPALAHTVYARDAAICGSPRLAASSKDIHSGFGAHRDGSNFFCEGEKTPKRCLPISTSEMILSSEFITAPEYPTNP